MNNIVKLQDRISNDSVCLIENPLNLRYFTNSDIDTGYLLISKENACFITDFRYIEVAEKHFENSFVSVKMQDKLANNIKEFFDNVSGKNLLIESDYQTISKIAFFHKITDNIVLDKTLDNIISSLRIIKDEYELEQIEKAQKITDDAFSHILSFIKPGICERDLALEIEFFMRKNGAEGVSFDLITISGKNTSLPHGVPSEKLLENGDFITMDIGCKVNGYCSDMTRTVALGYASDEMKNVYNTVLEAQKLALETVKSEIKACEVDKAARDYINKNGFEGCFGHATGHGVGLFIHEAPTVSIKSETILKPNMIITIEPGIYLKNQFGVRIEDMVAVTENACYDFTKSDKNLIVL